MLGSLISQDVHLLVFLGFLHFSVLPQEVLFETAFITRHSFNFQDSNVEFQVNVVGVPPSVAKML